MKIQQKSNRKFLMNVRKGHLSLQSALISVWMSVRLPFYLCWNIYFRSWKEKWENTRNRKKGSDVKLFESKCSELEMGIHMCIHTEVVDLFWFTIFFSLFRKFRLFPISLQFKRSETMRNCITVIITYWTIELFFFFFIRKITFTNLISVLNKFILSFFFHSQSRRTCKFVFKRERKTKSHNFSKLSIPTCFTSDTSN